MRRHAVEFPRQQFERRLRGLGLTVRPTAATAKFAAGFGGSVLGLERCPQAHAC
jgi:hypothetical protein